MSPFTPLTLPNGTHLINRLAKAAMEENLADADHAPSAELIRLYRTWAEGEIGLIITGNVMVDRRAMTGPGGVVLASAEQRARFAEWAAAGQAIDQVGAVRQCQWGKWAHWRLLGVDAEDRKPQVNLKVNRYFAICLAAQDLTFNLA